MSQFPSSIIEKIFQHLTTFQERAGDKFAPVSYEELKLIFSEFIGQHTAKVDSEEARLAKLQQEANKPTPQEACEHDWVSANTGNKVLGAKKYVCKKCGVIDDNLFDYYNSAESQEWMNAPMGTPKPPPAVDAEEFNLHDTIDAYMWAEEFMRLTKGQVNKEDMIGWFANAIMAGNDEANRRHPKLSLEEYSELYEKGYEHGKKWQKENSHKTEFKKG